MSFAASGSIVNVSSTLGLRGYAGHTSFGTSKWALRGLTKMAPQDLGSFGIRTQNETNHVSKELTVERWPCYRMCK
jgi:3alpha(or 20beta)-hydroxysteroid dehydrogenase